MGGAVLVISEHTLTGGWLAATEALAAQGREAFTLVLRVLEPGEPSTRDTQVREQLDAALRARGKLDTEGVANTIFPVSMLATRTAEALYADYDQRSWPVLRRRDPRGTYFRRLTHLDLGDGGSANPLAICIDKMRRQLARSGTLRCAYELAVYNPATDSRVGMGFPCLSHVSLKLGGDAVHLTALYRNQRYLERAYGNLLGLARLQAFIARETGQGVGELVCHATHAEVEGWLGNRALEDLLRRCRGILSEPA
jgi:hypothetical protein